LGQAPMPDFAPLGTADTPSLAGSIGWHVVVKHEALGVFSLQRIDDLLVARRAERGHRKRLGFTAGEQTRTVRPWQYARAYRDRTHGAGVAPIDARLSAQYPAADDLGLQIAEDRTHEVVVGGLGCLFDQLFEHLGLERRDLL